MADQPSDPQQAAMAMDLYQRQLDAVSRQIDFLQGVQEEVERARSTLEGMSEAQDDEILLPVGASTFVRGKIRDADRVIVGIGAGYATERTRKDAISGLEERAKQVAQELERLMQAAVQLQQEAAQLQERLTGEG